MTIRERLWEIALDQYGFVTSADAARLGIPAGELPKLAARRKLAHAAHGVYRFPEFPANPNAQLMEAVLWTRDPRAALSHDTALDVYELSDVNPNVINVTIPKRKNPIRRADMPAEYAVHYENLEPVQVGWWEQIPIVTPATAIDQAIMTTARPDLVRQAIDQARTRGLIDKPTAARQRKALKAASAPRLSCCQRPQSTTSA
jgi:predicted transcriptional regulator of viral defense system